jgi:hypothetical protein
MRTAISIVVALLVGYLMLAVQAYWAQSECVTAYAKGDVLSLACTSAVYTLPFSYCVPPLLAVVVSRGSWAAGLVVIIVIVLLGMELPNLSLAGRQWFLHASAYYLAIAPAIAGALLGMYICRLRKPRAA